MTIKGHLISIVSMPGGMEWFAIAMIGLLIFGKRLPEISKSLGRSIIEFKRGLRGVEDHDRSRPGLTGPGRGQSPPTELP